MIYEPDKDSFLLAKEVKKKAKGKTVLDLGTGSGIQSKAALEGGAKRVFATDIDAQAVDAVKKEGIEACVSDLFSKIHRKFELIAFNPPYLPNDKQEDKESSLVTSGGKRGDEITIRFLKEAKGYLEKDGVILLVVSSVTPFKRILETIKKQKMSKRRVAFEKMFMERLEIWQIRVKKKSF